MAMEMKLNLKMVQKLVMTPMLQQAIKLLPLARLELAQLVRQEIVENPVLEEILEDETEEDTEESNLEDTIGNTQVELGPQRKSPHTAQRARPGRCEIR